MANLINFQQKIKSFNNVVDRLTEKYSNHSPESRQILCKRLSTLSYYIEHNCLIGSPHIETFSFRENRDPAPLKMTILAMVKKIFQDHITKNDGRLIS